MEDEMLLLAEVKLPSLMALVQTGFCITPIDALSFFTAKFGAEIVQHLDNIEADSGVAFGLEDGEELLIRIQQLLPTVFRNMWWLEEDFYFKGLRNVVAIDVTERVHIAVFLSKDAVPDPRLITVQKSEFFSWRLIRV